MTITVRLTMRRTITRFGVCCSDGPAPIAGSRPAATCQPKKPSEAANAATDPV